MNREESDRRQLENLIDKELQEYDVEEHETDNLAHEVIYEAWNRSDLKNDLIEQTEKYINIMKEEKK